MRINICILTILTLLAFTLSAHAIDLKRLNKIQKLQQQNMLQQARNAAKAWNFTKAKEWLNKAEKQSYNPKAIKEVEQLISNERQAKATKEAEEARRRAEAQQRAEAEASAQAGKLLEEARIKSEQERQRLLNATGRLLIEVKFSGFLIDWTPTKYEVKVNQQKDIFGKYDYCCERTQRGGSGFWDNINAYFYDMKYGLYNVKVKAHLKQGKNLKTASFSAEVVLGSDSAEYVMTISGSSVHIFKR